MAKSFENFSSLRNSEIEFLKQNVDHLSVVDQHCVGYFDGTREELEDILERFLLLSSTCYVRKDLHSREKDHKRFSKSGRLIFYSLQAVIRDHKRYCWGLLTFVTQ